MIESQTKLPAQEGEPEATWEKGRQAVRSVATRVERSVRALPGDSWGKRLRGVVLSVKNSARRGPLQSSLVQVLHWIQVSIGDAPLLNRFALHLVVVFLAVGVVGFSQFSLPQVDFLLPTPTPAPNLGEHTVTTPLTNRGGERFVSNNAALFQAPVPHTVHAERETTSVVTYTVQPNDNMWAIAQGFGLKAETVLWANPKLEKTPDLLSVGQQLIIPPVDGVYYTVQAGDTVDKLAKTYQTSVEKIVGFEMNGLVEPYVLTPGQQLMLPDGRKKITFPSSIPVGQWVGRPSNALVGSGRFAWPTQGLLTQHFWAGHRGIDIAARTGTPIRAADGGYVVFAGRDTWGYGNQVVIDHGNGFKTRYAHLQTIGVKSGDTVKKDQKIGTMGNTGRSTGPHLHFEIIKNGVVQNPLGFLR